MGESTELSATRLGQAIRGRAVSPVDAVHALFVRIEKVNPAVNALVTVCGERALDRTAAERAVSDGAELGPLHDVPIGVKGLDPVAGVPTACGSLVFAEDVPQEIIWCVERLEQAGAIVMGETNAPEFGFKATAGSALSGPASTPFDRAMNAGGSCGSAAAVASGMVPLAQGFDAGGSSRVPAAFCGVFTLMPSFGRVPVPAKPNAVRRYDPMGCYAPLVRTVADATLGVELMSGARPYDPYSLPAPEKLTDALHCDLTGLTVAYSPDPGGYPVEPEPEAEPEAEAVAQAALPAPREAGATVEEVGFRLPLPHADLTTMWRRKLPVAHAESAAIARDNGIDLLGAYPGSVGQGYLDSVRVGESLGAVDLRPEDLDHTRVPYSFEGLFDRYDLVVSPVNVVAGIPDSAGRYSVGRDTVGPDTVEGQAVDPLVGWSLTSPFTLIGSPAASVPVGRAGNGVPGGLRLAARRRGDALVVRRRGDALVIRAAAPGARLPWAVAYQDPDLDATSA
ncbi:amidase [Streptomyces sp. NPDC006184]|uniref:amidase n=1 Tax=Streptomyces sp. NPDC006184 TaxID=3155455 RepID=UPI0033B06542